MSALNQGMSLCHFAPTTLVYRGTREKLDPNYSMAPAEQICAYCEKPCQTVPNFTIDQTALELTLRRYKDSDATYADTEDVVYDLTRDAVLNMLTLAGQKLYTDYNKKIGQTALGS